MEGKARAEQTLRRKLGCKWMFMASDAYFR